MPSAQASPTIQSTMQRQPTTALLPGTLPPLQRFKVPKFECALVKQLKSPCLGNAYIQRGDAHTICSANTQGTSRSRSLHVQTKVKVHHQCIIRQLTINIQPSFCIKTPLRYRGIRNPRNRSTSTDGNCTPNTHNIAMSDVGQKHYPEAISMLHSNKYMIHACAASNILYSANATSARLLFGRVVAYLANS